MCTDCAVRARARRGPQVADSWRHDADRRALKRRYFRARRAPRLTCTAAQIATVRCKPAMFHRRAVLPVRGARNAPSPRPRRTEQVAAAPPAPPPNRRGLRAERTPPG